VLAQAHNKTCDGPRHQWIYFCNSQNELESARVKVKKHLNEKDYDGDVVLITGPMTTDQKFYYTNLFLNSSNPIDNGAMEPVENDEKLFKPIGCMATHGLGSAGWDGPDVHYVFSPDLPTDICSAAQEKGRVGRRDGATAMLNLIPTPSVDPSSPLFTLYNECTSHTRRTPKGLKQLKQFLWR
jgi:hypothetical protein